MPLVYNISFETASAFFLVILYICIKLQYSTKSEINKEFHKLTLLVLCADILDVTTAVTISYASVLPDTLNLFLNTAYFVTDAFVGYQFMYYSRLCVDRGVTNSRMLLVNRCLLSAYLVILGLNAFNGCIFSMSPQGEYLHGNFYLMVYIVPYYFIACSAYVLLYHLKKFSKWQKVSIILYLVLAFLGPGIQMLFFPDVLLGLFSVTLALMMILFTMETPDYQKLVKTIGELDRLQQNLQQEVAKQTRVAEERRRKVERLSVQIMRALAATIDAKDTYTNGHSSRVAEYAREMAKRIGKSEQEQQDIYYVGLLHDLGKIGIPGEIINKTSRLTDEEYEKIKEHPVIGSNILKNISEMQDIGVGARWHHERYDGRGYPDGLKGEEIPETARIIGVADAYDAMTSKRSYRDVMPQEAVRGEIEKGRGAQFDPRVADVMLQMIDEDTEYRMHEI